MVLQNAAEQQSTAEHDHPGRNVLRIYIQRRQTRTLRRCIQEVGKLHGQTGGSTMLKKVTIKGKDSR